MASSWYIVNTMSGQEHKVAKAISDQAASKGVEDKFEEIVVPVENVTEVRRGKKITSEKKIFPGYILVKMELNDLTWNLVKNAPKVTGFLGSANKPLPVPEAEVKRVLRQVEEGAVAREVKIIFSVGETVKINEGPFETFTGVIEDVDHDKAMIRVSVLIFGRPTPVELMFDQVEKV